VNAYRLGSLASSALGALSPVKATLLLHAGDNERGLRGIRDGCRHITGSRRTARADRRWGAIFEDTTVATAVLDRLRHHASALSVNGDSYRMRRHRAAINAPRPALTGGPAWGIRVITPGKIP
jgi:hypothetical protein